MQDQIFQEASLDRYHVTESCTAIPQAVSETNNAAMILVGTSGKILSISPEATQLLGLSESAYKGQSVAQLGDALAAVAMSPVRAGVSHLIQLGNGHTVLAHTRTVVGRHNQVMGRVITLQDVRASLWDMQTHQPQMGPALGTLQQQIESMQELITMLPKFSHHRYWQNLLVEHMQRLVDEMTSQMSEISPLCA
jgi:PAS domain S-box-containing protein